MFRRSLARPAEAAQRPAAPSAAPSRRGVVATLATGRCTCGGACPGCRPARAPPAGGHALDDASRVRLEASYGQNLRGLRLHTDAGAAIAARAQGAAAFTQGRHIVFAAGRYRPHSREGQELLAHEVAHAVQQSQPATGPRVRPTAAHEAEADVAAAAVWRGAPAPQLAPVQPALQRRVELRRVGRGEASGIERAQELVDRLNGLSTGLDFALDADNALTATPREGGTLSEFDRQMQAFIDSGDVIPLRLTNHEGLLGDRTRGFTDRVQVDDWSSGYVDIDDLLASSDTGLAISLLHFMTERAQTRNYARRMGSDSMDLEQAGPQGAEFDRAHARGIDAEVQFLRDFFGDPSIRFIREPRTGAVFRVYRNARRDTLRVRVSSRRGVDAVSLDITLAADGRVVTPEEYQVILQQERDAAAAAAPAEGAAP